MTAHSRDEHFLPLLVAAGAAGSGTPGAFVEGGFVYGGLSLSALVFGTSGAAVTGGTPGGVA
ncbi:MAG: hypothetical protein FJX56_02510 [Alphaproteobacteria bacterium]|nr:hypothetical protein [Alphaproteobacteria bacterium]